MARRSGQKAAIAVEPVHDVYRDMLAEAASSPAQSDEVGRSAKKRRIAGHVVTQEPKGRRSSPPLLKPYLEKDDNLDDLFEDVPGTQRPLQQLEQTESEDSAYGDVNWEQVDLKECDDGSDEAGSDADDKPQNLNLVLQDDRHGVSRPAVDRRKPITAAEKRLRLEVHKMNVCALLVHVHFRNYWCNEDTVHVSLLRIAEVLGWLTIIGCHAETANQKDGLVLNTRRECNAIPAVKVFCGRLTASKRCFPCPFQDHSKGNGEVELGTSQASRTRGSPRRQDDKADANSDEDAYPR